MRNRKIIAVITMLLALAIWVAPAPPLLAAPQERHFDIEASRFQFTPSVITVNPGDRVTIDLKAMDVVHGLYVDDYGVDITADPGQTARLTLIADKPGTFRLRCSAACGAMHPFMIGKLNVGPNWLLWRSAGTACLVVISGLWIFRKQRATI
jgi:heme/copper-type cytochrome/quinol oxidase subunit 2